MTDIVIASAARTPVGAFNGGLSSLPAHKLGEVAIVEALRRAGVEPKEVSEVIMGRRHPFRSHCLWRQPALRLRIAHSGARLPGDP